MWLNHEIKKNVLSWKTSPIIWKNIYVYNYIKEETLYKENIEKYKTISYTWKSIYIYKSLNNYSL